MLWIVLAGWWVASCGLALVIGYRIQLAGRRRAVAEADAMTRRAAYERDAASAQGETAPPAPGSASSAAA